MASEVVEAVLHRYPVFDPDGDVVASLRVGGWRRDEDAVGERGDWASWMGREWPTLTYTYTSVREWNASLERLPDEWEFDEWAKTCSTSVCTPRWSHWLVEDMAVTDDELEEVRKSLGLEE